MSEANTYRTIIPGSPIGLCFLTAHVKGGFLLVDSGMVTPAAPLKSMLFLFTLESVDVVWRWRKEPGPLPVQDQGLWP